MTTCLNCENEFEGSFCNLCGQKAATHRFTMHEWLHEIPHSLWHVDSGFFVTMKTLFLRHGNAIREYLQGKRKLLFSPFLYVLILCGVYVVASHFLIHKPETEPSEIKTLAEAQRYIEEHYYKILVVAMIIPVTIGSYLAYLRSGFNFAENLVLNAYLTGQLVIADIIVMAISTTSLDEDHKVIFKSIEFFLKYPYWILTYWSFFRPTKWYWGILQYILSTIISGIALTVLMYGAAFILLKLKGVH
ncbi:MAG TPA: DUF3667 domain-containing protein [Pyrinomonadaceae bacterium]|nr:DUF3667 domain-containing protein [Pyrinomonadaceae bacterium]